MKNLPEFKRFSRDYVTNLVVQVLAHASQPEQSYFRRLVDYEDGHYGVVFSIAYFASTDAPTKSQWNSLKKKLKRHDKRVFIFKEHNITACNANDEPGRCGYVEFGFYAHEGRPEEK